MRDGSGPMGEGAGGAFDAWTACANETSIGAWETVNMTCAVDGSGHAGYTVVRALLNYSSCWAVNDTGKVFLEAAVAVVLPQPAVTPQPRNKNTAVFGGQMDPPTATGGGENAAAVARIGMMQVRTQAAIWKEVQPVECWEDECLNWGKYDCIQNLAAAGIEVMIGANKMCPAWAVAKNNSGPTWASFPGPEHYADYQRFMTLLLDRYGSLATAVEVSNEDDGLAYFQPDPVPLNETALPLALALVNLTAAAIAASANGTGLSLMGLSSSMFDIKQQWTNGPLYGYYERTFLAAPGLIQTLTAATLHPYSNAVWVPWMYADGRNISFLFPNETVVNENSTVAQLMVTAELMQQAAMQGGLGPAYVPVLHPSEFGYAMAIPSSATDGWVNMHAALLSQTLVHMRSFPLAAYVKKAYVFAAYDGCCPEDNSYFGLWRRNQARSGSDATDPSLQPTNLATIMPLPAVSAFATASVLIDAPSGRQAGRFILDNTATGAVAVNGTLLPSCVAFETDATNPLKAAPIAVLFHIGHHYNDRTIVSMLLTTTAIGNASLVNGLGSPLPLPVTGTGTYTLTLTLSAMPQYLVLPSDTTAEALCSSVQV